MSSIMRSVRRFMPTVEEREDIGTAQMEETTSEFRPMENNNRMNRSRSSPVHDDMEENYIAAHNGYNTTNPHKALSPKSPSMANSRYQLMDEEEDEEHHAAQQQQSRRDGPPLSTMETEKIQQSLHRVQRRVSESIRNLQDSVSKRLAAGPPSSDSHKTKQLIRSSSQPKNSAASFNGGSGTNHRHHDDNGHDEDNNNNNDMSDNARFLRKAVRGIRKSWSAKSMGSSTSTMDDDASSSHSFRSMTDVGYIRQKKKKDEAVVFTSTRDMELT